LHVLPQENALVVNLFNLSDQTRTVAGSIEIESIGLDSAQRYQAVQEPTLATQDGTLALSREMAPWSTAVLELRPTTSKVD